MDGKEDGKHLDYMLGVSVILEMKVSERADSSEQQEVWLLQNGRLDSDTSPLVELNVLPEVSMMSLPKLSVKSVSGCAV